MLKKVIIIGTAHPYRGGGIATFNERLAKEYLNQGADLRIETFTLQYPSFLFPGKTQYTDEPAPEGLDIVRTVSSVNPLTWYKVGSRIAKEKPDLVIMRFWLPFMAPCLGTIARLIKKNNYTKVVSVIDNIIPHEKRIGDKFLASYFVNSCHGFLTMSNAVLHDLDKFDDVKPKIFCAHPLYDNFGQKYSKIEACKKLGLDDSVNYILFFGFIRDYKGLDLLMRAFADKCLQNKNTKLLVAGEFYNNSQKYFDLEKELGLQGMIEWRTGFIPNGEVALYFGVCDIVAQPYYSATQSGVTQVAYHFEKPMLVTNVGGLTEIVPHNKVGYVTEVSAAGVANALVDFYDNNKYDEFVENVKLEKNKYSWAKMVEALNSLM